ncbi:MAG TPA: pitrilysin family protein [Gemmatimonadaceae bacterium]|nr:pitrilysin family protein [Gemmatimonadaceae bacterium]
MNITSALGPRPSALGSRLSAMLILVIAVAPLSAQQRQAATPARPRTVAIDRTKQPTPAKSPELKVPAWTKMRLSNGAELVVSAKRDLPLVSVSINFLGGANQFEDAAKLGVASFTTSMLNEGTTSRSGDQLADAQQLLGTRITANVGDESGSIGFTALSDKLEPALDLLADMMLNPVFPAQGLERLRAQRLVSLTQAKDQPGAIANNVFSKVVYGDEHPYGRVVNEQTTRAITREDVVAFHREYFKPGRASITVVGDVDPARVKAAFEKAFANWSAGGEKPAFTYPPAPASKSTTIYLVDKPKAAQSVINIGLPGPSRDTPDYYAISVMNHILGGLFQSRLNHLIREVKGYSYGVGSGFSYGRGPGAFSAGGDIVSEKTDSALIDFMNELRGVQGSKPFTEDEIKQGKESLIQSLPRRFASVDGVNGAISGLYVNDLPESYYQEYAAKIEAVTPDDLQRVAKKYIDLNNLNIVIVGDRATIEESLRKTGIAPIVILDIEGKRVPATP